MWTRNKRPSLPSTRWLLPGMRVKRYAFVAFLGMLLMFLGVAQLSWHGPVLDWMLELARWAVLLHLPLWASGLLLFTLGFGVFVAGIRAMNRSMLSALTDPDQVPEVVYVRRKLEAGPHIVALGGGTGLSRVLKGLKQHTTHLTAVVAVTDDGGSTGRLRRSFGVPAVGDLVDCLAALSDAEQLPTLMQYRFRRGGELAGHTFGNLFLVSLYELTGDFAEALRQANRALALRGAVYPSTPEPARLVAEFMDGSVETGETRIREVGRPLRRVGLEPAEVPAMPEVVAALHQARLIVLGPGSLYTSVIPSFLTPEVRRAIQTAKGRLVYLVNIMTECGETDGMDAYAHYKAVAEHLGRRPDVVLVNTAPVPPPVLARYRAEGQEPVAFDPRPFEADGVRIIADDFLEAGPLAQHDPNKVVRALIGLAR